MTAKELNAIHGAILKEKILHDADEGCVSRSWVLQRKTLCMWDDKGKLKSFILYDIMDADTSEPYIFIQMIWVKRKYRGKNIASTLTELLIDKFPKHTFVAYGNPQGRELLYKLGFEVGKTKYRECILRG